MTRGLCLVLALLFAAAVPYSSKAPSIGRQAMVATQQRYATQAGIDVLRAGGNAVDAAVAVAYALSVVDPCCGNIGGGGFMLVRMHDGRERFIDFRETAPARATRDMYLDKRGTVIAGKSTKGWLAVGVPGTVAGMETARREFGTMSRARLMEPAIALARDGFVFSQDDLLPFTGEGDDGYTSARDFYKEPSVAAIFLPDGRFPQPGTVFRQPKLARTLETISAGGEDAFYRGPIARAVVDASRAGGGILALTDFARYRVEEARPLHCSYRGYEMTVPPPPSSGGVTLCEILNVISPYPLREWGWHSARSVHYVTEAERRAYADRNTYLGDPDFVRDPVAQLLAPSYAAKLRAQILPNAATPSARVKPGLSAIEHENGETSHYSIVDGSGNAVAVTYTLNDWFGSNVIAGDTGFLLNDEMDDFTAKPGVANMYGLVQGTLDEIAPGKRPLSSMTPAIVTKNRRLVMVTGSAGGAQIITIVLQTILNALVYGMDVQAAVDAPRTHMQWLPDRLTVDPAALTPQVQRELRQMGYRIALQHHRYVAEAIVVDPATGTRTGGSDRRWPAGAAIGFPP